MHEDDLRERLARAASSFDPRPPVAANVLENDARAARRSRQHRRLGVAVAGTLGAVFVGGVAWQSQVRDSSPSRPDRSDSTVDSVPGEVQGCPEMLISTVNGGGRAQGENLTQGDIYLLNESCEPTPLIEDPTFEYQPAYTTVGGAKVAHVRKLGDSATALILTSVETGEERELARTTDTLGDPEFSPDGEQIVFWLNSSDGHTDIYVVSIRGGEARRITTGSANELSPTWSPDGRQIAYSQSGDDERSLIIHDLSSATETALEQAPPRARVTSWTGTDNGVLLAIEQDTGVSELTASPRSTLELYFRLYLLDSQTGRVIRQSDEIDGWAGDSLVDATGVHVARNERPFGRNVVVTYDDEFNEVSRTPSIYGEPKLLPAP